MTIREALSRAARDLTDVSDSAGLDAELLLAFALSRSKAFLSRNPEHEIKDELYLRFATLVEKRKTGSPVAYLTNEKWFYGRKFFVDERVLIPRPLTETLVEKTLEAIRTRTKRKYSVADIGTGSGCIAISIAAELGDHSPALLDGLTMYATDISHEALNVARLNAARHRVSDHITFLHGNLLEPLADKPLDLIVANLPYVPTLKIGRLPDPRIALDGGGDGERVYIRLKEQLEERVGPKPILLNEEESRVSEALVV